MDNLSNIIVGVAVAMSAVFCSLTITAWLLLGLLKAAGVCEVTP